MTLDTYITQYTESGPGIVKLIEENLEKNLHDIRLSNNLLDMTPKAKSIKAKLDKWSYIRLKVECPWGTWVALLVKCQT